MNSTFIVDNMLPSILVGHLRQLGYQALSIRNFGAAGAGDKTIWLKVEELEGVLISMDWDFVSLAEKSLRGKLIHYRRGNETTYATLKAIESELPNILKEFDTGKSIVTVS